MKFCLSFIEKSLRIKLLKNNQAFGFDGAGRTGWCIAKTNDKSVTLEYGFIDLRKVQVPEKYKMIGDIFKELITKKQRVIIEEAFLGFNPRTALMLARIGAIAYYIACEKECSYIKFLTAGQARKRIGIKGNSKKVDAQNQFKRRLRIKLDDDDIVDAMILALCGLIEEKE